MEIGKNSVVSINYILKDDKGNLLDSSEGKEPLVYMHGMGVLISGLEDKMMGMKANEKFEATIPPESAYGMYNDKAVHIVPLAGFEGDEELKEGAQVQLQDPEGGTFVALVTKIDGEDVTLDLNHPMAGMTLHFEIEILDVRAASTEEISHGHVHGPDGHHHH